jgi:uncharacterized protein YecE (DUF72 family)
VIGMPQTRIGISGWVYKPWRGTFYPKGLAHSRELEFASRKLNSIEINGTFYSLQRPSSFQKWYAQTPDDFVFAVKGPRFITHMKKLKDVRGALANFLASGVLELREKLGPMLWQFPPNFGFDAGRFEEFMEMLPRSTEAAAELAREHEPRMKWRTALEPHGDRPIRHAMEIRHPSFGREFVEMLRKQKIALVTADSAGRYPLLEDVTADFVYLRLHGAEELYVSGYSDKALDRWAERVAAWRGGGEPSDARRVGRAAAKRKSRDVYVYFDNDVKVRSPHDAIGLATRLA